MTYDEIKKWLEDNNYQNSGLRTDRNHRIDLYLSDVLYDFAKQQAKNCSMPNVIGRRGQLIAFCEWIYKNNAGLTDKTIDNYLKVN